MPDKRTRKVQVTVTAPPNDSVDYWLGGFVVFGMVLGALIGGVSCAYILASSPDFEPAVRKAPMVLAWTVLVAAEGAVSWAGVFPALTAWWVSSKATERRNRKWLPITLILIVAAIAFVISREATIFPLEADEPLGPSHHQRIVIMSFLVMLPPFLAIGGMWSSAIAAFELSFEKLADRPGEKRQDVDVVATYVELRDRVQSLLWYLGTVVGGCVLATGTLRQSMLDAGLEENKFPSTLVLAYGAFFTLLLIISYVPAYALLQRGGKRLVYRLADGDSVLAWDEQRGKLTEMLLPKASLGDSLKDAIAILSPIVAGFASLALPK